MTGRSSTQNPQDSPDPALSIQKEKPIMEMSIQDKGVMGRLAG